MHTSLCAVYIILLYIILFITIYNINPFEYSKYQKYHVGDESSSYFVFSVPASQCGNW